MSRVGGMSIKLKQGKEVEVAGRVLDRIPIQLHNQAKYMQKAMVIMEEKISKGDLWVPAIKIFTHSHLFLYYYKYT